VFRAMKTAGGTFFIVVILGICAPATALPRDGGPSPSKLKQTSISLELPSSADAGSWVLVSGRVRGPQPRGRVAIQQHIENRWVTWATTVARRGRFRRGIELSPLIAPQLLTLRALLGTPGRTVAVSTKRSLQILPRPRDEAQESTPPAASVPAPLPLPWPSSPNPESSSGPSVLELSSEPVRVQIGSTVTINLPEPIAAVNTAPSISSGGVSAHAEGPILSVSARADSSPHSETLTLEGNGCTHETCGRVFHLQIPVEVVGLGTQSPLEAFTEPSPDRLADAANDALSDELIFTLGVPTNPGGEGQAQGVAAAVGGVISGGLSNIGVYQVRWPSGQDLAVRRAALEAQPGVGAVSTFALQTYDADSIIPQISVSYDRPPWIWPYEQVQAHQAWERYAGSGISVGIIDEGNVFIDHEDLDVVATLGDRYGPAAHATHVAGLACARGDNQVGLTGLASGCSITTIGIGGVQGFFLKVLTGMTELAERPGIGVVNISLGENADKLDEHNCASRFQAEQIQAHATDAKAPFRHLLAGIGSSIVWTFSAGNNCAPGVAHPWGQNSDLDNVIVVGASNSDGSLASFSDYGARVDVAAPGGVSVPDASDGLMSSVVQPLTAGFCHRSCTSGYAEEAGTSMSSPIAAGIAALVREANPELSAQEAGRCIKLTAGIFPSGYTIGLSSKPTGFTRQFSVPAPDLPIVNADAAIACAAPPDEGGGPPAGPEVVSVDYQGVARSGSRARISRDGRYVWFESSANLVPGVKPQRTAVYVRNLHTATTERIDLPEVRHDQDEELVAMSPSGHYAVMRARGGTAYLYDHQNEEFTAIPRFLGYAHEAGLESDGDTMILAPSLPGSIVDVYSISRNEITRIPCPFGLSNGYLSARIALDNDSFAGISSEGCRYLMSGYVLNLATGQVREAIPGRCNNLGNACIDALATDESGINVFAEILSGNGTFSAYLNGSLTGTEVRNICGLSASGRHAIAVRDGGLSAYDAQDEQTTVISPPNDSGTPIGCQPQSVAADGTVAYSVGDQVLLAHSTD